MMRYISGKNIIRQKLGSDAGASITFALLLFLVCAMVSAVVLVAATTAAGRMASIAEADQRYYSVTSAAELLKDCISDKTVTVMTINGETVSITKPVTQITADDIEKANVEIDEDNYIQAGTDDKNSDGTDYNPVKRPDTVSGSAPSMDALVKKLSEMVLRIPEDQNEFSFNINVADPGEIDDVSVLQATVVVTLDNDKNATLVVYNTNTEEKPFKMTMEFSTDTDFNVKPAVSGVSIGKSDEISWHLTRVLTSYDASILDAEEGN